MLTKEQIGKNLTNLRENKGKERKEVCEELNISVSSLAMYENGERIPRDEVKEKLADYYQESIDCIFYKKQIFLNKNVTYSDIA